MSHVQTIKTGITNMLKERGNGLTFVDISSLSGFTGEASIEVENKNIHLWFHCSTDAVEAIKQLLNEKLIEIQPTSHLTYVVDGQIPRYPVAKQDRPYKTPRWMPAQIVKGNGSIHETKAAV